ncbi:uncharacterized protein LOC135927027 [Gordionus sp. m RMFG-2023]|uniref:uncharacterized protein LOC135927027 n=1 Tax=Gordionus sp. m RMFG-2023 TaxID=3053472 RepID=UPI0031FBA68D
MIILKSSVILKFLLILSATVLFWCNLISSNLKWRPYLYKCQNTSWIYTSRFIPLNLLSTLKCSYGKDKLGLGWTIFAKYERCYNPSKSNSSIGFKSSGGNNSNQLKSNANSAIGDNPLIGQEKSTSSNRIDPLYYNRYEENDYSNFSSTVSSLEDTYFTDELFVPSSKYYHPSDNLNDSTNSITNFIQNVSERKNISIRDSLSSPNQSELINNYTFIINSAFSDPMITFAQRGKYRIMMDLFPAIKNSFPRNDYKEEKLFNAVTIATHSTPMYLSHLVPMSSSWQGPISVAIYCPCDEDFFICVNTIISLRVCHKPVYDYVSFHIFYHANHEPFYDLQQLQLLRNKYLNNIYGLEEKILCPDIMDHIKQFDKDTYKYGKKLTNIWNFRQNFMKSEMKDDHIKVETNDELNLSDFKLYPINMARNIARLASKTHYIFTLDIEFLPSNNLMSLFLDFIRNSVHDYKMDKTVFVIPAFEVKMNYERPQNKTELLRLLKTGIAIPFHRKRCAACHIIPNFNKFLRNTGNGSFLEVLSITKWIPPYWEPIFISSNQDPLYDERFKGYGRNKIQMCYELCRADYLFYVLDGGFVSHQGISVITKEEIKAKMKITRKNNFLFRKFRHEIKDKYGPLSQSTCEYKGYNRLSRKASLISGRAKGTFVINKGVLIKHGSDTNASTMIFHPNKDSKPKELLRNGKIQNNITTYISKGKLIKA